MGSDDPLIRALRELIAVVERDRAKGPQAFREDVGSAFRVGATAYAFADALQAKVANWRDIASSDDADHNHELDSFTLEKCADDVAALLRRAGSEPPAFDILEDPTRGLHAVLTRYGIASRSEYQPLVTALVHWAADACRSTVRAGSEPLPEIWCSGCGCRWSSPQDFIVNGVVHLCGDCWRKAQPILHAVRAGSDQPEPQKERETTVNDLERGFHNRDGWMFRRDSDEGHVRIWKVRWQRARCDCGASPDGYPPLHTKECAEMQEGRFEPVLEAGPHVIPENEWASIVASVSRGGESAATWQAVRDFHAGSAGLPAPPEPKE